LPPSLLGNFITGPLIVCWPRIVSSGVAPLAMTTANKRVAKRTMVDTAEFIFVFLEEEFGCF
jgi:adenosylmethionine-8-amino-7-oxononanoate aminotransferase